MAHSVFGWSYPPGCSGPPDDFFDEPCEVCGLIEEKCVCPKCVTCGEVGRMHCYTSEYGGNLELTPKQIKAMEKVLDSEYEDKLWEKQEYEEWLDDIKERDND